MNDLENLEEVLEIAEAQAKQIKKLEVEKVALQKQLRQSLSEKQELTAEILKLNDSLQKMSEKNEKLNGADLVLIENNKIKENINHLKKENTDLVYKANKAIKQANTKEKRLDHIINEKVKRATLKKFKYKEAELERREMKLEEKRKKHITIISYVTIGIIMIMSLFSLGVYSKYQDAKELLDEGGTRLARAEDLEYKIRSSTLPQETSDYIPIKKNTDPPHSEEHAQLKEKVNQLFEDSSPLESEEKRKSAMRRYANIKRDVENAKKNLNTADYNWLKAYLDLTNSNLKYSK